MDKEENKLEERLQESESVEEEAEKQPVKEKNIKLGSVQIGLTNYLLKCINGRFLDKSFYLTTAPDGEIIGSCQKTIVQRRYSDSEYTEKKKLLLGQKLLNNKIMGSSSGKLDVQQ